MKVYDRVSIDQWFLASVGAVLLAFSLAGVLHAGKAAWASRLSYRAQKMKPVDVEAVLASCCKAYSLYPWNYYFSIFAAETAYGKADEARGEARAERLRQARLWCDRGLAQNPYKSQLRRLKTRFVWEESPAQAVAYWEAFTDWQYWEPYNHGTLAELYARVGEFDKAEQQLKLIEGRTGYESFRKSVQDETKVWEDSLNGKAGEWGE